MVAPQPTLAPQRHRGADRRLPIEHLGQGGAVHAQLGSCFADLQIQGGQDVVPQSEAGVWGGVNIELMVTSVVILVVHQDGIAVFKRKSQTPVAVHAD